MNLTRPRTILALLGATTAMLAASPANAQSLPDYYRPDEAHLLLFTSGGTFALANEQQVSWQVDAAQQTAFETWRKKLPGSPETSALVKELLTKGKGKALKLTATARAAMPTSDVATFKFDFGKDKSGVTLSLVPDATAKEWAPGTDAGETLGDLARGLGLKDRSQLESSLRTAGDGGKPWTHLVRMVKNSPESYLAIGHSGVLRVLRAEVDAPPPTSSPSGTGAGDEKKPETKPDNGTSSGATMWLFVASAAAIAGAGGFLLGRRGGGAAKPAEVAAKDGMRGVRVHPEEYQWLLYLQDETKRRLTSAADTGDREAALQGLLTKLKAYPQVANQVTQLQGEIERLQQEVQTLTYYKNYQEQPEAFRAEYDKLQRELETTRGTLVTAEGRVKTLEASQRQLTDAKSSLEQSLNAAHGELSVAHEVLAQHAQALEAVAAELSRIKERARA